MSFNVISMPVYDPDKTVQTIDTADTFKEALIGVVNAAGEDDLRATSVIPPALVPYGSLQAWSVYDGDSKVALLAITYELDEVA